MSLDFNFTNIAEDVKRRDDRCWTSDEGGIAPITKSAIFACMSVGMGEITKDNVAEFYARMIIMDKLDGQPIIEDGKSRSLTYEELIDHIGLVTNISNESRSAWARRMFVNKQTSVTETIIRRTLLTYRKEAGVA